MCDNNIDISVIIPMFNSENTIVNVLGAIENQTAKEHISEVIVVNDGSTDKSQQLVEKYATTSYLKIKLINKKNYGVSSARNVGMESATSKWLAFNDSDDYWDPLKIEKQIAVLEENPIIDFLGCNHTNRVLRIWFKKIDCLYKANINDICIKMFPQPSTVILKKQIFDEIGGFDEKQKYAEDGNFFSKICFKYNYYYMPEKLIDYGSGKREFGDSGLSANLSEMYRGNLKNIMELRQKHIISISFYAFLRLFYWLKHIRRIILTSEAKKS